MVSQYYLILIWVLFMGMLSARYYREEYAPLSHKAVWRIRPGFAFFTFLPIIIMATYRGWIGDTYNYAQEFLRMPTSLSYIPLYMQGVGKDKGFYLCSVLLKQVIGDSKTAYFFVIACIQGLVVYRWFRNYSEDYVLSVLLFIVSAEYLAWMFNGIRQFVAVVITLPAVKYLIANRKLRYIIVILIASLFHQTAIILIPIAFVITGEAWNKKTVAIIFITILAILFIGQFVNLVDSVTDYTQYSGYMTDATLQDDGANPIRALVYSVPMILGFVFREKVKAAHDPVINICVNMTVITAGIYWVSVFTSGVLLARLTGFTSLYSYILIPWIVQYCLTNKKVRTQFKSIMIIVYIIYYYYQLSVAWGL